MELKSILVTGGAGYIGSHAAKTLAAQGFRVIVFDNLSTGHRRSARYGELVTGDLANGDLVRQLLREYKIDSVLHFAAHAYVGESMVVPERYFRNNFVNTLNLLDAMLECGVRNIVFSSTCATYGIPESLPISEAHRQTPVNPYGESKLFVEKTLHWYGIVHGLRWVALRYFNAAGADPEGEIGEDHTPETHLIPLVIQSALGQRPFVEIFGTHFETPDGTAIRDYIHVTDLARAHILALRYLWTGGGSSPFNLGTGIGHSVRSVIECVERVGGVRVPVIERDLRSGDPAVLVANAGRAGEILGWRPEYTDLDTIVSSAFAWHSSHIQKAAPA